MGFHNNLSSFEFIIFATTFSNESFTFKLGAWNFGNGHSKSDAGGLGICSVKQIHEKASMFQISAFDLRYTVQDQV